MPDKRKAAASLDAREAKLKKQLDNIATRKQIEALRAKLKK